MILVAASQVLHSTMCWSLLLCVSGCPGALPAHHKQMLSSQFARGASPDRP